MIFLWYESLYVCHKYYYNIIIVVSANHIKEYYIHLPCYYVFLSNHVSKLH